MRDIIEKAWADRSLLQDESVKRVIRDVIDQLDQGLLRVAEPQSDGSWITHEWVKKAVILYFPIQEMLL